DLVRVARNIVATGRAQITHRDDDRLLLLGLFDGVPDGVRCVHSAARTINAKDDCFDRTILARIVNSFDECVRAYGLPAESPLVGFPSADVARSVDDSVSLAF